MAMHEHLICRTPITDAKRIIMMRARDKWSWSRVAGEMGLSISQCRRRSAMYTEVVIRLNAMNMREIDTFIKNHLTFSERFPDSEISRLGQLTTKETRKFDGVRHTNGRGGRVKSRA